MTTSTHEVLVTLSNGQRVVMEGEQVSYDGEPDWKYMPLDPQARAEWHYSTADPGRVALERSRQTRSTRGREE